MHNGNVITRFSLPTAFICFFLLLSSAGVARTRPKPSHERSHTVVDRDYVNALAAANRFLYAWQSQDEESGVLMLTDSAKHHTSADHLNSFFSPNAGVQQSYEITRGRKLGAVRYSFPVSLLITGKGSGWHVRYSHIVITKAGDDWVVDGLP